MDFQNLPNTLTLNMVTVIFVETLNNLHYSTWRVPKSRKSCIHYVSIGYGYSEGLLKCHGTASWGKIPRRRSFSEKWGVLFYRDIWHSTSEVLFVVQSLKVLYSPILHESVSVFRLWRRTFRRRTNKPVTTALEPTEGLQAVLRYPAILIAGSSIYREVMDTVSAPTKSRISSQNWQSVIFAHIKLYDVLTLPSEWIYGRINLLYRNVLTFQKRSPKQDLWIMICHE